MIEAVIENCVRCGKPLTKKQVSCRQNYCSRMCYHNPKEYQSKKCAYCGGDIPEKKVRKQMGDIKYCSHKCYSAAMTLDVPKNKCILCGNTLNRKQSINGQSYCSIACRDTDRLPACRTCGKKYFRKNKEKYCSEQCRKNSPLAEIKSNKIRLAKLGKPRDAETRKKLRLARLEQIGDSGLFGGQVYPCYNRKSCLFFNRLNTILGVNGLHAENGGEYRDKELGYWYDYYIPELKIILEWDEEKHFTVEGYRKKDLTRNETIYKNRPDHLLIRVRQKNNVDIAAVVDQIVAFSGIKVVGV